MKIKIEEIHSKQMFPTLIIGKPKIGMYEASVKDMENLIGNDYPIINLSKILWVQLVNSDSEKFGYGTYGHICGIKIQISKDDERYNFSVIFNYIPETENLNEKINQVVSNINYKETSLFWKISDL